jgi:hypothetical protein
VGLKEVFHVPIANELTIRIDNRPGSLGKVCEVLANHGVSIMAFQSTTSGRSILVCMVVDNLEAAESVLDSQGLIYTEGEVAQVKFPGGPSDLGRAASKLCEANININYAYFGVEPTSNAPLMIFGVTDVGRAATILDQTAAAKAGA